MQLIVNADDLGMSAAVNNATFGLMAEKLVTSATLIANGPAIDEACQQLRGFPSCSFGVHLNVSEFKPLSPSPKLQPLCDEDGAFVPERVRQISIDSALAAAIYEEFCAQIDHLNSFGVNLSHIDSHYHVHTIPKIFPILKRVQKRFQIRKVRISQKIYRLNESASWLLRAKKSAYNFALKHYYRTWTTKGFSHFNSFYEQSSARILSHSTFEAMVHSGNQY